MNRHAPNPLDGFRIVFDPTKRGRSEYRLVDIHDHEIIPVNEFLDAIAVRDLSKCTLRTYAYALQSIWRWMSLQSLTLEEMTEAHLIDYIRHLRERGDANKPPAPRSINLRLGVLRSLYRYHTAYDLPKIPKIPLEPVPFLVPSYGVGSRKPLPKRRPLLRVKVPARLVVPLDRREVMLFFESLRTWRDLSLVSLMLFCGLRSREVLSLTLKDLSFIQDEIRVWGKGSKERIIPLAPYARTGLSSYLTLERPNTEHDALFVYLKGRSRGNPMTPQGLREIFRYHRKRSSIEKANPHRFRHTFAVDMIRVGISLPILMRLMGHSQIQITMRYVNLSAEDVRQEFERAMQHHMEKGSYGKPMPENPQKIS
ncbi:MAG: tyrosine-type recombinase/integrase [Nitrospirota bacterium]|nr:MAG: tyrosine-type recombinase/integrase [Nitrospirota bacterium]